MVYAPKYLKYKVDYNLKNGQIGGNKLKSIGFNFLDKKDFNLNKVKVNKIGEKREKILEYFLIIIINLLYHHGMIFLIK